MATQSEAALEKGLIETLQQMSYEYVVIKEEENLKENFKRQLEKHNKKPLAEHGRTELTEAEFDKVLLYLEGDSRFEKAKKLRAYYDDVNKRMKKKDPAMKPLDLCLVVGMFLTGFDSKKLNTLYVDKNLELLNNA